MHGKEYIIPVLLLEKQSSPVHRPGVDFPEDELLENN
jgi:hypothetical protein